MPVQHIFVTRLPETMSGDASEDSAVQDFLQILEEHRKNCERQGKYVEAEIAKNRIGLLRAQIAVLLSLLAALLNLCSQ